MRNLFQIFHQNIQNIKELLIETSRKLQALLLGKRGSLFRVSKPLYIAAQFGVQFSPNFINIFLPRFTGRTCIYHPYNIYHSYLRRAGGRE